MTTWFRRQTKHSSSDSWSFYLSPAVSRHRGQPLDNPRHPPSFCQQHPRSGSYQCSRISISQPNSFPTYGTDEHKRPSFQCFLPVRPATYHQTLQLSRPLPSTLTSESTCNNLPLQHLVDWPYSWH